MSAEAIVRSPLCLVKTDQLGSFCQLSVFAPCCSTSQPLSIPTNTGNNRSVLLLLKGFRELLLCAVLRECTLPHEGRRKQSLTAAFPLSLVALPQLTPHKCEVQCASLSHKRSGSALCVMTSTCAGARKAKSCDISGRV